MTRIGGFPRINRPASPSKDAPTAVEAKTVPTSAAAPIRHGLPRRAPPQRQETAPLPPDPASVSDVEPEFDEEGRLLIKAPLRSLPRQVTILNPKPASTVARPPVRPPGSGLLAKPRPVFQPPVRTAPPPPSGPRPVFRPPARVAKPTLTPDDIPF
jgi:hypothetical protein